MNSMYQWFELIGGGYDTHVKPQSQDDIANAGDLVKADAYYDITGPTIKFNWLDITTGVSAVPVSITTWTDPTTQAHYPASQFYNGTSAEVVDERAGSFSKFGSAGWADTYAVFAGSSAAQLGTFPYEVSKLMNGSTVLGAVNNNDMSSTTNFVVNWKACS